MTNSPEPNQPERDLRRRIREMDWRIQRLEATQMPAKSIDEAIDNSIPFKSKTANNLSCSAMHMKLCQSVGYAES